MVWFQECSKSRVVVLNESDDVRFKKQHVLNKISAFSFLGFIHEHSR